MSTRASMRAMVEKKPKAIKKAPKDAREVKASTTSKTEAPKRKKTVTTEPKAKVKVKKKLPMVAPTDEPKRKKKKKKRKDVAPTDEPTAKVHDVPNAPTFVQGEPALPTDQELARQFIEHEQYIDWKILFWRILDPTKHHSIQFKVEAKHPTVFFGEHARHVALCKLYFATRWFDIGSSVYATAPHGERCYHESIQQMSTILRAVMLSYAKNDSDSLRELETMAIRWLSANRDYGLDWPPIKAWSTGSKKRGDRSAEKDYAHSSVHEHLLALSEHYANHDQAVIAENTSIALARPILCMLLCTFKDDVTANDDESGRLRVKTSILTTLHTQHIKKWGDPDFTKTLLRNVAKKLGVKDKTAEEMFRYAVKRKD